MHIWRHGLYEVPSRYGETARFFRQISQEDSIRAFMDYAASRGGHYKVMSEILLTTTGKRVLPLSLAVHILPFALKRKLADELREATDAFLELIKL